MPPHCDSMDGPVVRAARQALDAREVDLVLPFVPADAETEIKATFDAILPVRDLGPDAARVADRLFFETVVRLHRAGEGAPYTGLKPAGLSPGPVIPLAERAVETGSTDEIAAFLSAVLQEELIRRLGRVTELAPLRRRSVQDGRRYVEAMLGFEVFSHHLLTAMRAREHDRHGRAHEQHE